MLYPIGRRQAPELWIKQKGAVTVKQAQIHFGLRTEQDAQRMLDGLVLNRRLMKTADGKYEVPRRRAPAA